MSSSEDRTIRLPTIDDDAIRKRSLHEATHPGERYCPPGREEVNVLEQAAGIASATHVAERDPLFSQALLDSAPATAAAAHRLLLLIVSEARRLDEHSAGLLALRVSRTNAISLRTCLGLLAAVVAPAAKDGRFEPSEKWWIHYWADLEDPSPWRWHRHYLGSIHAFDLAAGALISKRNPFDPRCLLTWQEPHRDPYGVERPRRRSELRECTGYLWKEAKALDNNALLHEEWVTRAAAIVAPIDELAAKLGRELEASRLGFARGRSICEAALRVVHAESTRRAEEQRREVQTLEERCRAASGVLAAARGETARGREVLGAAKGEMRDLRLLGVALQASTKERVSVLLALLVPVMNEVPADSNWRLTAEKLIAAFEDYRRKLASFESKHSALNKELDSLAEKVDRNMEAVAVVDLKVERLAEDLVALELQVIEAESANIAAISKRDHARHNLADILQEIQGVEADQRVLEGLPDPFAGLSS